jgi:hypothetical protein
MYFWNVLYTPRLLVRKRAIPTELPSFVGEVNAKFVDRKCRVVSAADPYGRYFRVSRPENYSVYKDLLVCIYQFSLYLTGNIKPPLEIATV